MSLAISLDEPKRVLLRARQTVTLLHHPPPYEPRAKDQMITEEIDR
jgi:hypothetical protein